MLIFSPFHLNLWNKKADNDGVQDNYNDDDDGDDDDDDDDEYKKQQNPKAQVQPCAMHNLTACHTIERNKIKKIKKKIDK